MRLFDTHCHFETLEPSAVAAILARARAAGVGTLMAVGGSAELNRAAALAQWVGAQGPMAEADADGQPLPCVRTALGFDREQVDSADSVSDSLVRLLDDSRVPPTAIGEIGLDYHYSPETRAAQMKLFAAQLEVAQARNLPVVIHTREAASDTAGLLKEIPSRGIIHCFTGTPDEARVYLDLGFYVSISGIVTFKAADNVRLSARYVPDDRILIETDAPFLAPVPMRGQVNEPAFLRHTCAFLAALRGRTTEVFAELTFANAETALRRQAARES